MAVGTSGLWLDTMDKNPSVKIKNFVIKYD